MAGVGRPQEVVIPSGATQTRAAVIPSEAPQARPVVIPSGARSAEARNRDPPGRGTALGGTERQTLMTQIALSRCARSLKKQKAFQGVRALGSFPAPPRRKAFNDSDPLNATLNESVVAVSAS